MDFLSPWSLAGWVLVPAIFLWGLLAPRGRPVTVGSLMLWRRALGAGPAGKPSAKVRLRDPLLWLDAAAAFLLVAACAQPALRTTAPDQPVATLVVDRTASMAMESASGGLSRTSPSGPRYRQVEAMAERVLDPLGDAPIRLVSVPAAAGDGLTEETTVGDLLGRGEVPWKPLLADRDPWPVAIAEAASRPDWPVLLATDIARAEAAPAPANLYVLAPGGRSGNAGLTRVAARIEGGRWWLLVSAKASAEAPGPYTLECHSGGQAILRDADFLAPGQTVERTLPMTGPPPRDLTVSLVGPPDGFPADDAAYLVLVPGRQIRVRLIGAPDPALRRALASRPDTEVKESPAGASVPAGETDLLIACATALPADWTGPAVAFLPPEPIGPVTPAEGEAAGEWRIAPDGPLADVLRREPPRIGSVRRYTAAQGGQLLLGTADAPLIVAWESQGSRRLAILFGFDERTTDWPRRWGFPLFWSHALDWLAPGDRRPAAYATYRPLEFVPTAGQAAPNAVGFQVAAGPSRASGSSDDSDGAREGRTFGVSFIGTDEGFQAGAGRDDSAAATEAIRRAAESARRASFYEVWPFLAAAALLALLIRVRVAR